MSPKLQKRLGAGMSALAVAFLLFDSAIKFSSLAPVAESFERLGWSPAISPWIGAIELACTLLYLAPRTALLGAVLLTGHFGGAIASHLRVGDPMLSHTLFPLYVSVLVWGGLYLRDRRVALLLPSRLAQAFAEGGRSEA